MKKLHLVVSVLIIVPVAIAYGAAPGSLLTWLFDVDAASADMHNIFRAIMGLYLAIVCIWIAGIVAAKYWETATITNIVFMGGLAAGRLISFILDGLPSRILIVGFFVECFLAAMAYYNWRKYKPG